MLNIDHGFLFSLGQGLVQKVHDAIKDNSLLEGRATFRHFDLKMLANIIQKNHKNFDFHWITHYSIFETENPSIILNILTLVLMGYNKLQLQHTYIVTYLSSAPQGA